MFPKKKKKKALVNFQNFFGDLSASSGKRSVYVSSFELYHNTVSRAKLRVRDTGWAGTPCTSGSSDHLERTVQRNGTVETNVGGQILAFPELLSEQFLSRPVYVSCNVRNTAKQWQLTWDEIRLLTLDVKMSFHVSHKSAKCTAELNTMTDKIMWQVWERREMWKVFGGKTDSK